MLDNIGKRVQNFTTKNKKNIFRFAGICSILIILLTLMDIIVGTSLGGDLTAIPQTAVERFAQLQHQPWLGLYYLDLLNLTTTILMIPVFIALYYSMKKKKDILLTVTLVIFAIGTLVFIRNNAAIPMYSLSRQFAQSTLSQQTTLLTNGEKLLAMGAHGSVGVFPGFALCNLSSILLSICMIQGNQFSRKIGIIGLIGTSLLLVYLFLVTFVPDMKSIAMGLAAPGGILSLIWMILYTKQLFRLSAEEDSR